MGSCEGGVVGEGELTDDLNPTHVFNWKQIFDATSLSIPKLRSGFVLQPNVAAPAATLGNQDY
jgi:hypothetical protein